MESRLANTIEVFKTDLRWVAAVYDNEGLLSRLSFYNDSKKLALAAVEEFLTPCHGTLKGGSELQTELSRYAQGTPATFAKISLSPCRTKFQTAVRQACRAVGYGKTATYGELAHAAGSPKAARAVGLCMRNNPIPIVVPCHRIVGVGDRLIGFSAGPGISLKMALLEMEGVKRKFVNRKGQLPLEELTMFDYVNG